MDWLQHLTSSRSISGTRNDTCRGDQYIIDLPACITLLGLSKLIARTRLTNVLELVYILTMAHGGVRGLKFPGLVPRVDADAPLIEASDSPKCFAANGRPNYLMDEGSTIPRTLYRVAQLYACHSTIAQEMYALELSIGHEVVQVDSKSMALLP